MKFDDIIKADQRREGGAWITEGFADLPGLKLKVRGEQSAVVAKKIREISDAATDEQRKSPEFGDTLNKAVMLDAVLIDWRIDGTAYSREAAEKLLETAVFREAVIWASRVVAKQGEDTLADDTGN